MKIDDALRVKLVEAVEKSGGARAFSLRCGINAANISRYQRGLVHSINDDNWEKLAPFLGISPGNDGFVTDKEKDVIIATPELTAFIAARMKSLRIRNVEKLRKKINFSSYEILRRQLSGKLNWFADTLSRVVEVLDLNTADLPLSDAERRLLDHAAMKRQGSGMVRVLPVLAGIESGKLSIDGKVPVPLDDERDLRAFRISGRAMSPVLLPGDVVIAETVASSYALPENSLVVIRFTDQASGEERWACRRCRHLIGCPLILSADDSSGELIPVFPADVIWCGVIRQRISYF